MAATNTITNAPPLLLAAVAMAQHSIRKSTKAPRISFWIQSTPHTVSLTVRIDDRMLCRHYASQMVVEPEEVAHAAGRIAQEFAGAISATQNTPISI